MRKRGKEGISCRDQAGNGPVMHEACPARAQGLAKAPLKDLCPSPLFRVEAERGWMSKGRREEGMGS